MNNETNKTNETKPENPPASGMTLRDWFAGQWLAGRAAKKTTAIWAAGEMADAAYKHADAMLAERSKEKK